MVWKVSRPAAFIHDYRVNLFAKFVYKKALSSAIGEGLEQGSNPRQLEKDQNVRSMNLFADKFLIGGWDPNFGGRQVESRVQRGDEIPEHHLQAWRIAREEILGNVVQLVRLVIEQYYAWTGKFIDKERLFHYPVPEELWSRLDSVLTRLAGLLVGLIKASALRYLAQSEIAIFGAAFFKLEKHLKASAFWRSRLTSTK
jgi:hypothetical protein